MALSQTIPQAQASSPASSPRSSVSSGSPPANVNFVSVSGNQLLSRLDALRVKARNMELSPRAGSSGTMPLHFHPAAEDSCLSNFEDCHERMEHWWKEHLQAKAALVHAACREFPEDVECDESLLPRHPVCVDRYPAQKHHLHY